jgi:hypothetical protein
MRKLLSIVILLCLSLNLSADPAPFGLEIGKASLNDIKKKYSIQHTRKNKYTGGDMYSLNPDDMGIEGLQSVTAILNKSNKLVAILTTFPKTKFKFLFNTMKQKRYKLTKNNIPFVGNTSAEFRHGRTIIILDAPHLSFQMDLHYIDYNTFKAFKNAQRKEAQQKKKAEQSKL